MSKRPQIWLMWARLGTVAAIALLLFSIGALPAWAHGGEESDRASDLVLQAIALIVNEPNSYDMIRDKVADALKAKDTKGVDLALVREARDALEARQLHRTRSLLERAIGARPHRGVAEPAPIREVGPPPRGAEPGRALPSDPLPGREGFGADDWAILVGALTTVAVGIALSIRYRPRDTGTTA